MENLGAAPNQRKPLKPARELATMVTKLPREERLRVEGIILGLGIAHCPKNNPPTKAS